MDYEKTVSVVVLNWNGKRFIDSFLKTLSKQTYNYKNIELIFTDNDSSDNSVEYFNKAIKKINIKHKLVQNDKNYGYAGGNNRGMRHASGDYILVCNNDLELDPNLVAELLKVAVAKRAAVTVPKLMYLKKQGFINNAGSRIDETSDWPIYEIGANENDNGQYNEIREITAFCGACVLFSREFLKNVGVFDEKFFMYFEDGDLSWRGQKAGSTFYYAPKAVALHYHTGTSKEGSPLFNHFVGRNRILILTKNGKLKPLVHAWLKTLNDHILLRIKRLIMSLANKYPKRLAINEFWLSQKMIWDALLLTPYVIAKRVRLIKEETL